MERGIPETEFPVVVRGSATLSTLDRIGIIRPAIHTGLIACRPLFPSKSTSANLPKEAFRFTSSSPMAWCIGPPSQRRRQVVWREI